jgi:aspartyl-tRNA(Asn)/glutamyl-tRNA(Gln) amidotransferase subunit C
MPLSRAEIEHLALLARLALTEADLARLGGDLNSILAHFGKLAEVATDSVEPTTHAVPLDGPWREDAAGEPLTVAEATAAAPASRDGFFVVPAILDTGEAPR